MLSILWLYKYKSDYDFDNWLHLKFVEVLKEHPDIQVMVYGPDIHVGYPHLTTLPYDRGLTISDIRKHFPFDAVIMNTKSRMFEYYNPHVERAEGCWVPEGLRRLDAPKIVIEEDYHYEKDDKWYSEVGTTLILQRHHSQWKRRASVPMGWFPFSVDTTIFRPPPENRPRQRRIAFAGSMDDGVYQIRQRACHALRAEGLIEICTKDRLLGEAYIRCLQTYIANVCCSSTYRLTTGKMFEIMSAGSILLANRNDDLPLLFPSDAYCAYKDDATDIVEIAKGLIGDRAIAAAISRRGRAVIEERHSHKVRILELQAIVGKLLGGKTAPAIGRRPVPAVEVTEIVLKQLPGPAAPANPAKAPPLPQPKREMQIATLVVNRNDPQRTDALVERLQALQKRPRDIYVLESGSDLNRMSKYANVWYMENINWPQGFNLLRQYADRHKWRHAGKKYDAYWMICNDVQLPEDSDPWETMERVLADKPDWGIAHPYQLYFSKDHIGFPLNKQPEAETRKVSFVEFVCPMFRRELFERFEDEARLGKTRGARDLIDERFTRGWGIDYEMCYWAYALGLAVYNVNEVGCLHYPNTSHVNSQETKTEDQKTFLAAAKEEMLNEMAAKWGRDWGDRFCQIIPDLPDKCFRNWSAGDRAAARR